MCFVFGHLPLNCWREGEENAFNQYVSIKIRIQGNEELSIHVVYRSPNSSRENDEALSKWIRQLRGNRVIIGDLNFPGIEWEAGRADAKGRGFFDACTDTFLEQRVSEATHINGNRLDLVLTNQSDKIREVKMDGRLDRSDHEIIYIKLSDGVRANRLGHCYRNFNKANYRGARMKLMEVDWEEELGQKDVNEMWKGIKDTVTNVIEQFVPWKQKMGRQRPKWYNKEVEKQIGRKRSVE